MRVIIKTTQNTAAIVLDDGAGAFGSLDALKCECTGLDPGDPNLGNICFYLGKVHVDVTDAKIQAEEIEVYIDGDVQGYRHIVNWYSRP